MYCEICGEALTLRQQDDSGATYACLNNHWYLLSPTLGWLVIPAPAEPPDPDAAGVSVVSE